MKNKFFHRFIENKLVTQMVFAVTASIAIIIIFLTGILSHYYEKLSCEEIYRNTSSSLNQAANVVQFLSESANSILLQISRDPEVNRLFLAEEDEYSLYQITKKLANIRYNNSKIYSIYICDEKKGYIFTSGENDLKLRNDRDTFYDESFIECLENINKLKVFSPIVRTVPVIRNHVPETTTKVLTYFYFEPYFSSTDTEKKHIIAINVSSTWMSEALGYYQGANPAGNNIEIVNRDGRIIFNEDSSYIGTQYENAERLNRILSGNEKNGYFIDDKGDKKLVTFAMTESAGYEDWIFLSENDYEEITSPIEETKRFMYLVSMIVMLVSIGSLLMILRPFFHPIKLALNKAKLLEKERLEKQQRDAQTYLRQLLEGDHGEDRKTIRKNFERLEIGYDFERDNQLLLVSIDNAKSLRRKYKDDFFKVLKNMSDVVERTISLYYDEAVYVNMMNGRVAVILCLKVGLQEEHEKWIAELFSKINEEVNEQSKCTVSIAVSSRGESVKDLPFLLAEAQEIQTYRYLHGYGKLLTTEVIRGSTAESFVYPKEQEKEILEHLYGGQLEETRASYEKFLNILMDMPVEEIKISFLLLAYAIKYASKNTTIETSSFLLNFEQFFAKIQSLETISEVNNMFLHLFSEVIEVLERQRSAKYDELIEYMKKQIVEGYGNADMSVKEIADKLDMSAAYLGRIFKQHTGVSFTEYLTKYRLQMACDDLANTEKIVNEISDRTGFTNSSYFYLVFKKYLGCTPIQYRNQKQEGYESQMK